MVLSWSFSTLNDNITPSGIHDLLMYVSVMNCSLKAFPFPEVDQATG